MNLTPEQQDKIAEYLSRNGRIFIGSLAKICDKTGLEEYEKGRVMVASIEGMLSTVIGSVADDEVEILNAVKGMEKRIIDIACKYQTFSKKRKEVA